MKVDVLHTDWLHHVSSAQSVAGIDPCRPLPFKGARYAFVCVVCVCVCVCVCMRVAVVPLVNQRITFALFFFLFHAEVFFKRDFYIQVYL